MRRTSTLVTVGLHVTHYKALYNAICWSHTKPMILRAIAPIRTCYEIFWFYGDSFPWPSDLLLIRRAKQMVLEQGWATPTLQEDEKEDELPTATLDITSEIGSDFELLPEAEVRYTYQDLAFSTEQLHQWSDTDNYANTAGAREIQKPAKGKK